jgi:F420-dependent oxidoreductase-like protein
MGGGKPVDYGTVKDLALTAEALGFHSIFANDHLIRGEKGYILEGWTVLSALASVTSRVRLGNLVLCNSFRYPQLLAKMTSTLDVISGGRFELGIGGGWLTDEFTRYGIPFPKPSVRLSQLAEALDLVKKLWTQDRVNFTGDYYTCRDAPCEPKPLQKPHPPIMIGGGGEKLTLKVVAQHGDICNFGGSLKEYSRRLDKLMQHCETVGRDSDEIEKSWTGDFVIAMDKDYLTRKIGQVKPEALPLKDFVDSNIVGTPDECLRKVQQYLDLGVDYFTISGFSKLTKRDLELIAEKIMPSL